MFCFRFSKRGLLTTSWSPEVTLASPIAKHKKITHAIIFDRRAAEPYPHFPLLGTPVGKDLPKNAKSSPSPAKFPPLGVIQSSDLIPSFSRFLTRRTLLEPGAPAQFVSKKQREETNDTSERSLIRRLIYHRWEPNPATHLGGLYKETNRGTQQKELTVAPPANELC